MKYFLLSLLLFAGAFSINAQNQQLTLASDVWPPFTNKEGNKAIATAIVRQALNRSGIKIIHKIVAFSQVLKGINSNLYDGTDAIWHSEERASSLIFSMPYLQNRLILVGKKGTDVSATSLKDLKGKTIGVVDAYDYGIESDSTIHLIHGKSDQSNLQLLLEGKEDYMLVDALLVQYLLTYQEKNAAEYLEIGTTPLIKRPLHFAISKDVPNAEHIIERFNKEITKMVADGTYNEILSLNWISMDIDGDGETELVLHGTHGGSRPPAHPYNIMAPNTIPSGLTNPNNRFYIEGQTYDNWDAIPNQYKTAPLMPSSNEVIKFKFRLQDKY